MSCKSWLWIFHKRWRMAQVYCRCQCVGSRLFAVDWYIYIWHWRILNIRVNVHRNSTAKEIHTTEIMLHIAVCQRQRCPSRCGVSIISQKPKKDNGLKIRGRFVSGALTILIHSPGGASSDIFACYCQSSTFNYKHQCTSDGPCMTFLYLGLLKWDSNFLLLWDGEELRNTIIRPNVNILML